MFGFRTVSLIFLYVHPLIFTHSETEDGLFNVVSSVAIVPGLVAAICFQSADELQMFGPASVRELRANNSLRVQSSKQIHLKSGVKSLWWFEKVGLQSWKPIDG